MTSAEFRKDAFLVKSLGEIVDTQTFQIALSVLETESPLRNRDNNLSAERMLGRIEGSDDTITKLKSLTRNLPNQNVDNEQVV